jgi:hypothetical protein
LIVEQEEQHLTPNRTRARAASKSMQHWRHVREAGK